MENIYESKEMRKYIVKKSNPNVSSSKLIFSLYNIDINPIFLSLCVKYI